MLNWEVLLPATAIGFLSMGVLNLNNMRDIDNDIQSGKHTLASRLGFKRAKSYHTILILAAVALCIDYVSLNYQSPWNFLFLLAAILMLIDLAKVLKIKEQQKLDPFLKKLAISTFLFTLMFGVGLLI